MAQSERTDNRTAATDAAQFRFPAQIPLRDRCQRICAQVRLHTAVHCCGDDDARRCRRRCRRAAAAHRQHAARHQRMLLHQLLQVRMIHVRGRRCHRLERTVRGA